MFQDGETLLVYLRERRRTMLWPHRRPRGIAEASLPYLAAQSELQALVGGTSAGKELAICINTEPMVKILFAPVVSEYNSMPALQV